MENSGRTRIPILLISADPIKNSTVEDALALPNLELIVSDSAYGGIRSIREMRFALVILDLDLPGMDGFSMVRRIRRERDGEAVPILFLSFLKPSKSDLRRNYLLGIVDYLSVPFDSESLRSKVSVLAHLFEDSLSLRKKTKDLEIGIHDREERLRQKDEDFRLIVENAKEYAIFMLDPEGRITSWNIGAQRLLGYEDNEIIGRDYSVLFTPEEREKGIPEKQIGIALATGHVTDERWHYHKNGRRFCASCTVYILQDDEGAHLGFVKIMRDHTEREIARRKLEQSEERFRLLVEEIHDYAILMIDPQGIVMSWNKGAESILGYASGEIVGSDFSKLHPSEDLEKGKPALELQAALEKGRIQNLGWRIRKDGSRFWADEIITRIRNKDGQLNGYTKVIRDITQERKADADRAMHVEYLERISEITKVLDQNLDMEQILRTAVGKVMELLCADRALLIHPLDPEEPFVGIPYFTEKEEYRGLASDGPLPTDRFHKAMAKALSETTDPIVIGPDNSFPGFDDVKARLGVSTLAVVSIRPKNGKPWALGVHQCSHPRIWSQDDLRLLKDISVRLSDVLDNLILHRNLRKSESRFRWLVESTTEMVWRFDLKHPIYTDLPEDRQLELIFRDAFLAECTDAMARVYGYAGAAEIIGEPLVRLLVPTEPENVAYLRNFIRFRYHYVDAESLEQDKYGKTRYILNNLVGILEDGHLIGAWGTSRDITDRRVAEEEVRRSRDLFNVILQGIADAILVYSPAGSLVYFNDAASRMFALPSPRSDPRGTGGMEAEEALKRLEILDEKGSPLPQEWMPIHLALQGVESPPTLLRYRMGVNGTERWLVSRVKPILDEAGKVRMVIGIAQDTTELKMTEDQFRQSQKMEAIGRLAGGIAHDFNNLLTAINGYSELLLTLTEKSDPRQPYIEEIRKAGERAASLTNQLLVYSRRQIVAPKLINLNIIVAGMEVMLRRLIGEDVELVVRLSPDLDAVKADPGQMEQVILNLAVNSRDAMPKGGRLILETSRRTIGQGDFHGMDNNVPPGNYVQLYVSDTGVGMEDTVKSHLFEPFFTTKKTGQGTGLGLSTVYGIVRQSGGYVIVESEQGEGATFRIFFPVAQEKPKEPPAMEPEHQDSDLKGTETILMAEDDQAVRSLVRSILASFGYRVLEGGNGFEALETATSFSGKIDLLLTDVVMSQMGGRELADRMKMLRPDLKILYMSGYTDDDIVRHGVFAKSEQFIQKPFTPESLGRKIREILDFVTA